MASSTTLESYAPADVAAVVRPTSFEPSSDLSVAVTPGGKAVYGWTNGNRYRFAVAPSLRESLSNGYFTSASDVMSAPTVYNGAVWVDGGDLFAAVRHRSGNTGTTTCYVANDAENPTSWSIRGTVVSYAAGGSGVVNLPYGGPVFVSSTGTWVLPMPGWGNLFGLTDFVNLYISTNRGASWYSAGLEYRSGAFDGLESGPMSSTLVEDPVTGYIYWWRGTEDNHRGQVCVSMDGGLSWTIGSTYSNFPALHLYADDGSATMYAARPSGSTWRAYRIVDPMNPTSYVDTGVTLINNAHDRSFKFIKGDVGAEYLVVSGDRITFRSGGWKIGEVGIG